MFWIIKIFSEKIIAMEQQTHRPGVFKLPNKKHKGDHISARTAKQGGRTAPKAVTSKKSKSLGREQRRNQMANVRKAKREEVLNQKRNRGTDDSPPFLVAIIPLCGSVKSNEILESLKKCPDSKVYESQKVCHINATRLKQRFAFVKPAYGDRSAILDAARVADCLLLCVSIDESLGRYADHMLTCLFAQGLPSVAFCAQGLKSLPIKKQSNAKKDIEKQFGKRFVDPKIHSLDDEQDAQLLLRSIGGQKQRKTLMRECRPYLFANDMTFEAKPDDETTGTLKVTGYLRGQPLSVDQNVHIPGFGDFQLTQIDAPHDPHRISSNSRTSDEVKVLERADPGRVPLEAFQPVDATIDEQTWPTEEEMAEADEKGTTIQPGKKVVKKRKFTLPKGVSEYQAAWWGNGSDDSGNSDLDDDDDDEDVNMDDDNDGAEEEEGSLSSASEPPSDNENDDKEDMQTDKVTDEASLAASEYDKTVHFADDEEELKRFREARDEEMFPDEVDFQPDVQLRVRLQKYRGLASFRSSPWERPDDDWPSEYQRIAHIENFRKVAKDFLNSLRKKADSDTECRVGRYVTLHIDNVPSAVLDEYSSDHPLVVFGLLKGEHFMSVVHFLVQRLGACEDRIRNKDPMIFQVGYRRFTACPIYSQHTNGNKFKMERFLFDKKSPVVATVYAPIIFPPASVLMFKQLPGGEERLVAAGRVLSVDPNRVVVKRIVLTGHPARIFKKSAIVKQMFYNREDVMWFKPVGFRTKNGRTGNIIEPMGTHGHMKCLFNNQLIPGDVVTLNLYKRAYPKLTYNARVPITRTSGLDDAEESQSDKELMEIFD